MYLVLKSIGVQIQMVDWKKFFCEQLYILLLVLSQKKVWLQFTWINGAEYSTNNQIHLNIHTILV